MKNKFIELFWGNKVKDIKALNPFKNELNSYSISIEKNELQYFYKITDNDILAQFSVLSTIYSFLLIKYFDDFNGNIYSYNSIIEKKGENNPFLFTVETNLKDKIFKQYLQSVAKEVQSSLEHIDYESEFLKLDSFSYYGICLNDSFKSVDKCKGLLLDFKITSNGLHITTYYRKAVYNEFVIKHLVGNIRKMIVKLQEFVNSNLGIFSIFDSEEKRQLLFDFNNTFVRYPKDKTIVDLFEEQVKRVPDNIALICDDIKFSYKELNEKANQLANYIGSQYNFGREEIIPVLLLKSSDSIVSLLAILKIGGVYLPIDPAYPIERINYILSDSNASLIISHSDLISSFNINTAVVRLDKVCLENISSENLFTKISPHNLAYVIYTSGSTGSPKGVLVEHTSNVNMSLDQIRKFEITDNDKVVWFASVSFDASMSEIMMSLYCGATLIIPLEEQLRNKNLFVDLLRSTNSTVITFPPSYLNLLDVNEIKGLRCIITAGEAANLVKAIEIDNYGISFYNAYGPTEYSVCASIYKFVALQNNHLSVPIGSPISNTRIYILDEDFNLLPIGVSGKIYLSGAGVARGYLNKAELTTEKFISNPYEPGGRMYDTGDIGRWLPDGNVDFLGRRDHQVKIRGYRIELGEVETAILQYSLELKQAVVEVKEVNEEKILVAYFVSIVKIDKSSLRNFLQAKLPEYMLPAYYVSLDSLPLTPNGKIDRKKLPDITGIDIIRKEYVAPRNATEQQLVVIWQEALGLERVGITDNFFELGGHSLTALHVINRICREINKTISFKNFFSNPTIKAHGKYLTDNDYIPIPPAPSMVSYPLTSSQRRLWILSQLEGGALAYNMPATVKLIGKIDKHRLEKSFKSLILRHEILRTSFKTDKEGEISQHILPAENFPFKIQEEDFTKRSQTDEVIFNFLQEVNSLPFDLKEVPLIRASLIKLKEEEYVFFFSMHHIIGDGWSAELLLSEVVKTYNGFSRGIEIKLPLLGMQFKDYAVWLNKNIETHKYQQSQEFWIKQFEGQLPVLELPSFKKRPTLKTFNGKSLTQEFSKDFLEMLKMFSHQHEVTLFMTLMAGLKILLHRYSGQEDIIVGTPIAGREHPDLENQIGLYLNTLAIRSQFKAGCNFIDVLYNERETLMGAYLHQRYPFDELVNQLELKRDASRSLLFDVMIVLQNQQQMQNLVNDEDLTGLKLDAYDFKSQTSQFDLSFNFKETSGLSLSIEYNTDIYDSFLIERMFPHFEKLLTESIKNPKQSIAELEYLTTGETYQLLEEFNDRKVKYPKDKTIIDLFEEQVEETPGNIAVIFEDKELTYKELNNQANQLGAYLREKYEIRSDDLIGIKLNRGEQLIVAIMGILKSGAAYVPIDPDYPEERIKYIETDSKCKVVIDDELLKLFKKTQLKYPVSNLNKSNTSKDLLYVLYTSGTTGFPKGVMVEHRNVVRLFKTNKPLFDFNSSDVWTMFHSYCFDFSVWEMYGALLYGGRLFVISSSVAKDAKMFLEVIRKNKVTVLNQTPSSFYHLDKHEQDLMKHDLGLRYIIFGGESLSPAKLTDWHKNYSTTKLINMYGITETTVHVTFKEITKHEIFMNESNIGKPIPTLTNYVFNNAQKLVAVGVIGELYVGGEGVSRGYLNNSDLTSQRFVINPYKADERLYRSGDLVKMFPNGDMEYIGRIDQQVKIRGFRIELGEVETALLKYSLNIKDSVVQTKEVNGENTLVAYFVSSEEIDKSLLRNFLQLKLPEYMVPGYYVSLENMPVTPNGKIDHKALPEITSEDIIRKEYLAPRNETEYRLVKIWREILGIEKIGVTDNFFELGGHSLKASTLISKIHQAFHVQLPLGQVFALQNIKAISTAIWNAPSVKYASLKHADKNAYYPLSSAQKRLYFLQQFDLSGLNYNMPIVISLSVEFADIRRIEKAFKKLIHRHESLRTCFVTINDEIYQYIQEDVNFKVDYKETIEKELAYAINSYIRPFDLKKDILIRACLINVSNIRSLLIVDMHHIISDGTTCIIIKEDFMAYMRDEVLEPLKYQYKDFSEWQNSLIAGGELFAQEKYWIDLYSGDIPRLELLSDFKRPEVFNGNGANYFFVLDEKVLSGLNKLSIKHGGTLYMTLLAILNTLFYKYTNQEDIIIGTGLAGRPHLDLQRIAGMFVNTLAIRNQPAGEKSFADFLEEVIENCISAFEHQDVQFEDLVDKLNVERNPSRNPLFDICLMLQNFSEHIDLAPASGNNQFDINTHTKLLDVTCKFDLTFFVSESSGKLQVNIEYYRALYLPETIERLALHFCKVISEVLADPSILLKDIEILEGAELRKVLIDFNKTEKAFSQNKTIHQLIEEQSAKTPDSIAVLYGEESITYKQLDERANMVANYLIKKANVVPDAIVAILMDKSIECIVAILGILKSGAAYLPIAVDLPVERIKILLDDSQAPVVISEKKFINLLNKIQWECNSLERYLCIDSNNIYEEDELQNNLMDIKLWEYIGERGIDAISKGGWLSSYTGLPISQFEMSEYSDNVFTKLHPLLDKQMRVLEIGCASGITMFRLAPYVGLYYGTDLSRVIIEDNRKYILESGFDNIILECLGAHEIEALEANEFDLIIINSVIQNFHGYNYLRDVIKKCIHKLGDKGLLFVGDIMDADRKKNLVDEMAQFKNANDGAGYQTKTDWSEELFVSRSFFEDLRFDIPVITSLEFSNKIHTVENELTKFRYDMLMAIDKNRAAPNLKTRHKYQDDKKILALFTTEKAGVSVTAENLCYVIYTSGTTGKPKGVLNEHIGIVNRLFWAQEYFQLNTEDRILQKTTLSFDVSVWELFWPLMVGAKLVFASQEGHKDADYLQSVIEAHKITTIHFVPSMLEVFLLSFNPQSCRGLKRVLCSGEALLPHQVDLFRKKLPYVQLYNLYGPTEAAVDVSCFAIPDVDASMNTVPIGKPVFNTQLYILNTEGIGVPIGIAGELHIGGIQVARGYLNRPELTAEKFIYSSFMNQFPKRLYRTGDLARWLPDGNVEYLGRIDDQIKIRGYRVEPEEIKAVILQNDKVSQCAVINRKRSENEDQLIAYYVPKSGKTLIQRKIAEQAKMGIPLDSTLVELPNGLPMYSYNRAELFFLYEEIFTANTYLKNGITISDGDCVFDVGANLGMFSIFSNLVAEDVTVYAFEPLPPTFNLLKLNTALYDGKFNVFPYGISDKEETISFRHYQNATILSSRYMEDADVINTVKEFINNTANVGDQLTEQGIKQLLEERLVSEKYDCNLKTLSSVIAEHGIKKINLLKIDVEKAELDVLDGIHENDWCKIEQLVLEVHDDSDGRLEHIKKLLVHRNYEVIVEGSTNMANAKIYDVFAISKDKVSKVSLAQKNMDFNLRQFRSASKLKESIQLHVKSQLPEYMIPAFFVELDELPLNSNGKLNRKALPEPEFTAIENFVTPANPTEKKLLKIWASILKIDESQISVNANFMALGGHSLSATRVVTAMREQMKLTLNVKDFFVYPTIASMSAYLQNRTDKSLLPAISPQPFMVNIPLAFAQERLWFIDRLQGSVAYHMPSVLRLQGDVNLSMIDASFKAIVERHQVLRTIFKEVEGKVYQEIKPATEWKMNYASLEDEDSLKAYVQNEINTPFNLSRDFLFRINLVTLPRQEYIVIIVMHHIVSDGWSMSVMVSELLQLYHGFTHQKSMVLPALSIQYTDYAIWQNKYLRGDAINKQLEYWKIQLRGVAPLHIPSDFQRTTVQSTNGATIYFPIDKRLTEQLKDLSLREGVTLFMTTLAAFKALLYRYTYQEDICVGVALANRTQSETESLIGFFVNALAIRSKVNKKLPFNEFLQQVKTITLEGYANQDVPFEKVIETVVGKRNVVGNPLIQVMFVLQNTPDIPEIKLDNVKLTQELYENVTAKFDLTFDLSETTDGMRARVEYCSDLFKPETIQRMITHYENILQSIVENSSVPIRLLKMISADEEQQLIYGFNDR